MKLDPCNVAVGRFMFTMPFASRGGHDTDHGTEALCDRKGGILCLISWEPKWRCYVARAWNYDAVMSEECLVALAAYLKAKTAAALSALPASARARVEKP